MDGEHRLLEPGPAPLSPLMPRVIPPGAQWERRCGRAERVRIARELHDVVAYGLTVMTVQAACGGGSWGSAPPRRPARWRPSMTPARIAQDDYGWSGLAAG
jgi:hypothetical protein